MHTATEKLRAAAVLIAEVMDTLNTQTAPCDGCNQPNAEDPTEFKAYLALRRSRQKLLDWADTLYLPREQRHESPVARRLEQKKKRRGTHASS